MEDLTEFVSFWGGIASLVALALTLFGAFYGMLRWGRKRREAEFQKLAMLRMSIAERARSATTQGKRMDLFIYFQSLLSHRRFSQTLREIQAATLHVISAQFCIPFFLQDANANYYIDRLLPPTDFMRNNFEYIALFNFLILLILNGLLRTTLVRERRRLNESANGLTDELQNYLEKNDG